MLPTFRAGAKSGRCRISVSQEVWMLENMPNESAPENRRSLDKYNNVVFMSYLIVRLHSINRRL